MLESVIEEHNKKDDMTDEQIDEILKKLKIGFDKDKLDTSAQKEAQLKRHREHLKKEKWRLPELDQYKYVKAINSLIQARQAFQDTMFKNTILVLWAFSFLRLLFRYPMTVVMATLYPVLGYVALFGFTNFIDLSILNLLDD